MTERARDRLRRAGGALFLVAALAMVIVGLTPWGKRLEGRAFIHYWLTCWAFTTVAMIFALWDLRITRARTRMEKRELVQDAVKQLEKEINKDGPERNGD
jgi:hypothetical protein